MAPTSCWEDRRVDPGKLPGQCPESICRYCRLTRRTGQQLGLTYKSEVILNLLALQLRLQTPLREERF